MTSPGRLPGRSVGAARSSRLEGRLRPPSVTDDLVGEFGEVQQAQPQGRDGEGENDQVSQGSPRRPLEGLHTLLRRSEALIVDEFGYLPLPGDGASALFQVINQRYLKSRTILTTNVEIAKAHMFRRTRARCCRTAPGSTRHSGSSRSQMSCGHPPRAPVRCWRSSGSSVAAARR
ncbi:ATP-binding protein [Streptomyces sp. NPDC058155]|uniref:ATP-binding protein n=1 Tax=Streptomyces sp. NPDC058155 TaxID=3346359 RepID=UPI0036EBF795